MILKEELIQHVIDIAPGDRFYAFTDGFADQFGGDSGKKLMRERKKVFLTNTQDSTFSEHRQLLKEFFLQWQGELEQVDDVMVVGIEF